MSYLSMNSGSKEKLAARAPKGEQDAFFADIENAKQRRLQKKTGPVRYRAGSSSQGLPNLPSKGYSKSSRRHEEAEDASAQGLLGRKLMPSREAGKIRGGRIAQPSVIEKASSSDGGRRRRLKAEIVIGDMKNVKSENAVSAERDMQLEKEREEAAAKVKLELANLTMQELPSDGSDEESEDETDRRRRRARLKAKAKENEEKEQEAARAAVASADEEEEGDSESEYETDTDEEDDSYTAAPLLKPVFVSKKNRVTVSERERAEAAEMQLQKALLERKQQRKKETLEIVVAEVKREEEGEDLDDAEALPPDDDDMDEEEEMDQWKLRELRRIKRDKEQEEEYEKTLSDVERRRMMTDEEVIAENKNNPKKHKPKGEMRFMQKYYHPGAFFADTDSEHRLRDFTAPTGQDKTVDMSLLPKVLQVKKWGLKGRTKYTHLNDQDTTRKEDNPWNQSQELLKGSKKAHHLAGTGGIGAKRQKTHR